MADNNDNIDEVSVFPLSSLATKATFSHWNPTRYSSPSEVTFAAGNLTEPAPTSSVLLRPQLSRQNSSGMVSEPFWKKRVVTFWDNFDDEEQDDENRSRADGNRALSVKETIAAQEAAEVAATGEVVGEGEEDEIDREIGLKGSRYILSDDEEFDEDAW
ncbi:uncharacterized protein LOC130969254 [Arachis stenosperma]|uniref:uncharacterized protein LOC130969254 n=1 Tax=Arachis stenosperma TaxID=217475 RepID=UPI0025AD17D3|nr:uncharacterized protein LOC130969254 [Arachis stenosperma]